MTKSPIDHLTRPVSRFIHLEYTSGLILFLAVVLAIVWVNSPLADWYHHLWKINFTVGFGQEKLSHSLHDWINDGLMAIFFFVIGLELKREFIAGELSSFKKAVLPMFGALGGMIVPACIYEIFNHDSSGSHGWGIPMATDIAFALAILSMSGSHIPSSVKIFLSALAVADDLGAVLVIAFFYTADLQLQPLWIGGVFIAALLIGNLLGIRNTAFYILLGLGVWVGFLLSGVHATIAGVIVAFTIPARRKVDEKRYSQRLRELSDEFDKEIPDRSTLTTPRQHQVIEHVKGLSIAAQTPLQKIETAFHPWVAFVIMPLFALANAGISVGGENLIEDLTSPVSLGVSSGLVVGKFVGIMTFILLLIKLGFAQLPERANWVHMIGVSILAGVGFTMSLFVSSLAFNDVSRIAQAKYGILLASVAAGVIGTLVLRIVAKPVSVD